MLVGGRMVVVGRIGWRAWLICCWCCSVGCGVNIAPPYLIDDLRIIAVVAEPPQVRPGSPSALTAVIANPRPTERRVQTGWSYCPRRNESQNDIRCSDDAVSLASPTPEEPLPGVLLSRSEHGFDAGDAADLPTMTLEAGFWEHVRIHAYNDDAQTEAIKRLVVTASEQWTNNNPELVGLRLSVDGTVHKPPYRLTAGDEVLLQPEYGSGTFEPYQVPTLDGSWESRHEGAVFTWQVTGGLLDRWVTLGGDEWVRWTLPQADEVSGGRAQVFVVLRDGRGGVAVSFTQVLVD